MLADGSSPSLLNIVEIHCERKCDEPTQPENWLVQAGIPWRKVGEFPKAMLPALVEKPKHLWLNSESRTDRVAKGYLSSYPPEQSLYLINLEETILSRDPWNKYRLSFRHGSAQYALRITDPDISLTVSSMLEGAASLSMRNTMACISLAPPFNGYHYKLVATLFR